VESIIARPFLVQSRYRVRRPSLSGAFVVEATASGGAKAGLYLRRFPAAAVKACDKEPPDTYRWMRSR
jgi:hypothetical protein